jgi:hypothetical protein
MNGFVDKTKEYFTATLNMMNDVLLNYNYGVLSLISSSSDKNIGYNTGNFNGVDTTIFGKPLKTEEYIRESFNEFEKNIDNGELSIFNTFNNTPTVTAAQVRLFKKNYKNYLNNGYKTNFSSELTSIVNTLVQVEQDYVYNVDRLNFVTEGSGDGKDGKINDKGIAQIFSTTGTTESINGKNTLTSLRDDYATVSTDVNDFLTSLTTSNVYSSDAYQVKSPGSFTPPSSFNGQLSNQYEEREYLLMSRALSQKNRQDFVNKLIEGLDITTSNIVRKQYEDDNSKLYDKLNASGLQLVSAYRTSPNGKKYLEYTPSFGTTQTRITLASENTEASNDVKKTLQNIYSGKNDSNKTEPYNFKSKFN